MAGASDAKIEQLGDERKGLPSPTISSFVEDSMDDAPGALRLNNVAKETLISLTRSMFRYSRAYQALFFYHVFDAALQLWQVGRHFHVIPTISLYTPCGGSSPSSCLHFLTLNIPIGVSCQAPIDPLTSGLPLQSFYPESLPLVTESEYSLVLNSTALVNYWLCYYFLDTCGRAFVTITEEKEDSLPEVLKVTNHLHCVSILAVLFRPSPLQFPPPSSPWHHASPWNPLPYFCMVSRCVMPQLKQEGCIWKSAEVPARNPKNGRFGA